MILSSSRKLPDHSRKEGNPRVDSSCVFLHLHNTSRQISAIANFDRIRSRADTCHGLQEEISMKNDKAATGRHFEDFKVGEIIRHPTPRTVTSGDKAVYQSIFPNRHAVYSSDAFAQSCGLPAAPLHELAGFHIVFGKSVPDVSRNAVANLGYANWLFRKPVHAGDTLQSESEVIGMKQNSSGKSGIVWVRTRGQNQRGETVVEFVRWVMVRKRDPKLAAPEAIVPELPAFVASEDLPNPDDIGFTSYDFVQSGEPYAFGDYEVGEQIDHVDCVTIEEAEHMMATRLWQNTARVHFDASYRSDGRRLVYGGHVISLARALSFNGLANAQILLAVNSGTHTNPCYSGDTVGVHSEILDLAEHPVPGAGAVRIRTRAIRTRSLEGPVDPSDPGNLLLELDYWALVPR